MSLAPRLWSRALALAWALACGSALAQPAGWTYVDEVRVFNRSSQDAPGYQLALELDTATLAAQGQLRPDAGDLRFGADTAGNQPLPYWIESGIGTNRTVVWIRLPSLAANAVTRFYIYRGNPNATNPAATSILTTLQVFDYGDLAQSSAMLQRSGGRTSVAPHSVRGMRFETRQDVLVVALGKSDPQGTPRVVTLWNATARQQLMQLAVGSAAGQYGYAVPAAPVWLPQGGEFMLTLQQGANEGYYYSESTALHPALNFLGARYCNQCDASTFPTLGLAGVVYGYADMLFMTRKHLAPEPDYEYETIIFPPDPVEPEEPEPVDPGIPPFIPGAEPLGS